MLKTLTIALAMIFATSAAQAKHHHHHVVFDANANVTYIPNPCTYRRVAFCGCAARIHLGIADRRLDLAANWPRLYHGATPVAVWRHHVAVIDRMTGPHTAILWDYNSGGHRSRHWERDISGARIIGGYRTASTPRSIDRITQVF